MSSSTTLPPTCIRVEARLTPRLQRAAPPVSMISYQLSEYGRPLDRTESPTPVPEGAQVLLRIVASGVCHSDLHLCDGHFDLGDGQRLDLSKGRELPLTLGHEIAGEVVAVGPDGPGDIVGECRVVYPWVGCRACNRCARGDEHLCGRPQALGVVRDGGFAEYVVVPDARYLFDYGAVDGRVACTYACSGLTAYGALLKVREQATEGPLLVVGAGGVGLAAVAMARAVLATKTTIVVADIDETRRQAALEAGADIAIDPTTDEAVSMVRQVDRHGVRAAVDFVGSADTAGFAVRLLGQGGVLIMVGLFGGALKMRLPLLPLRQLTLRGSYVGSLAEMSALTTLARAGKIPPIPLSNRPLDEAQNALEDLGAGRAVGRIVLHPSHPASG